MTSLQRGLNAMNGRVQERPPYSLLLSLYGSRLIGADAESYYRDPDSYARGQAAVRERFQPDIIFGPFALSLIALGFGAKVSFTEKFPPTLERPAYRNAATLLDAADEVATSAEAFSYLHESVASIVRDSRGEYPVCGILAAPIDLPILLLGMEGWMETLLFEPETAENVLSVMEQHFSNLAASYFQAGATFIATPLILSNPVLMPLSMSRKLLLPSLGRALSALHGPVVIHHGGNRILDGLADMRDWPNAAGFVIDARESLDKAREQLPRGQVILGNIDGPGLLRSTPEGVLARADEILDYASRDPRFIIQSSGADIPWETDPKLLDALCARLRREEPS